MYDCTPGGTRYLILFPDLMRFLISVELISIIGFFKQMIFSGYLAKTLVSIFSVPLNMLRRAATIIELFSIISQFFHLVKTIFYKPGDKKISLTILRI